MNSIWSHLQKMKKPSVFINFFYACRGAGTGKFWDPGKPGKPSKPGKPGMPGKPLELVEPGEPNRFPSGKAPWDSIGSSNP